MPMFFAGLFALYLLLVAIKQFGKLTPADAAKLMRKGGVALGAVGLVAMLLRGRFNLVGGLISMVLGLTLRGGATPFARAFHAAGRSRSGRITKARSSTIEMSLNHDSGALDGVVFAGPFAGRQLRSLGLADCRRLYQVCVADDPEGAALLETYFDRRFPRWREADESETEARSAERGSGAMSRDEAYEVLGLPKGASTEEVIRAHRSLMKKFHPDHGGSTALAARVNQAKDVLVSRHV